MGTSTKPTAPARSLSNPTSGLRFLSAVPVASGSLLPDLTTRRSSTIPLLGVSAEPVLSTLPPLSPSIGLGTANGSDPPALPTNSSSGTLPKTVTSPRTPVADPTLPLSSSLLSTLSSDGTLRESSPEALTALTSTESTEAPTVTSSSPVTTGAMSASSETPSDPATSAEPTVDTLNSSPTASSRETTSSPSVDSTRPSCSGRNAERRSSSDLAITSRHSGG